MGSPIDWVEKAAEDAARALREAAEAAARVAQEAAEATAKAATDAANAAVEAANEAARVAQEAYNAAVEAANEAARVAQEAEEAAAKAVVEAANEATRVAQEAEEAAAKAATDAGNSFVNGAVSAWSATSDQAKVLVEEVEKSGMVIGNGFIDGANAVKDATELASEKIVEGAVELGNYVSSHACDIAIGCALSAVFVALAAEGEEEVAVSAILAATIAGAGLQVAARGLSIVVVEPVWLIPGVSDINLTKEQFEDVISFIIVKACGDSPKLLVGTAGQFLVGVLIYGITSLICEGVIPGGYEVWSGAQNSIDRTEQ
jgi:hypothetical protein